MPLISFIIPPSWEVSVGEFCPCVRTLDGGRAIPTVGEGVEDFFSVIALDNVLAVAERLNATEFPTGLDAAGFGL